MKYLKFKDYEKDSLNINFHRIQIEIFKKSLLEVDVYSKDLIFPSSLISGRI